MKLTDELEYLKLSKWNKFVYRLQSFFASSICRSMGSAADAAKSPEPPAEQKMQPRVPRVPSRFGQVTSALRESL